MELKLFNRVGDRAYDFVPNVNPGIHVFVEVKERTFYSAGETVIHVNTGSVTEPIKKAVDQYLPKHSYYYYSDVRTDKQIQNWAKNGLDAIAGSTNDPFAACYANAMLKHLFSLSVQAVNKWFGQLISLVPLALPIMTAMELNNFFVNDIPYLNDLAMTLYSHPETAENAIAESSAETVKKSLKDPCARYIGSDNWQAEDERVLTFLKENIMEKVPGKVEKRMLDELNGLGLPFDTVADQMIERKNPDALFWYLSNCTPALFQALASTKIPFPSLLGLYEETGQKEKSVEIAKKLICATEDSGFFTYLADYLGQKVVSELAESGSLRPIKLELSHRLSIDTDLYELSQESYVAPVMNLNPGYITLDERLVEQLYAFPHVSCQLLKGEDTYNRRAVRERMREYGIDFYTTEDEEYLKYIKSDSLLLISLGDSSPIKYIADGYYGNEDDFPQTFSLRIRLCDALGKRVTFAQPYGTGGNETDAGEDVPSPAPRRGRKKKIQ
ncbi:MAG: hypothetical protein IJU20_08590 [Clostridia bacterium]|nr:hypothetical protein [Clostridia bacterium]